MLFNKTMFLVITMLMLFSVFAAAQEEPPDAEEGYVLDIAISGPGWVDRTPDLTTYPPGTEVELGAYPAPCGAHFQQWTGDLTGTEQIVTIIMTQDMYITARFSDCYDWEGHLSIIPGQTEVETGAGFTTQVALSIWPDQLLAAYGLFVEFESDLVAVDTSIGTDGVEQGADGMFPIVNAENPGRLMIAGFDHSGVGPGSSLDLLTINWLAVSPGEAHLVFTIEDVTDPASEPIPIMYNTDTTTVRIIDDKLGDVNEDNAVDIIDALMIAGYCVGLEPDNFNPAYADTDCSGTITIVDALVVAQYCVGLISGFPCNISP